MGADKSAQAFASTTGVVAEVDRQQLDGATSAGPGRCAR